MTVDDVIELIKKHRKQHLHPPIGDDVGDPLRWSEGGFQRAIVEEYDTLLAEIQRGETHAKSKPHTNSRHAEIPH